MVTRTTGAGATDGWMPSAVVLDLDDTLIPQRPWLDAAAARTAEAAAALGLVDMQAMHDSMLRVLDAGSDRPGVIDRALALAGADPVRATQPDVVPALVEAFMATRVAGLPCSPGARELLLGLREHEIPVGILTDGRPSTQLAKLEDAGLDHLVDRVLITDSLGGREFRKPDLRSLVALLASLGCSDPATALVIGDRPGKDTAVARAVGARAWRVRTGEYANAPDEPPADLVLADLHAVARALGLPAA